MAIRKELQEVFDDFAADNRSAVLELLKTVLADGRAEIRRRFDGQSRAAAGITSHHHRSITRKRLQVLH